ncbi:hypothetical protein [Pseudoxanthomonas winnipegensis]|uniref:hypothetical protein n=1 Tax=Pseudoxanthomonas winnipegensis TaxID=2480810 RepID=UPI00103B2A90|nr:hypothetical protein [Pseudoxanthomonas winnipegensis]TBV74470.1 hypothetical protein EYC45_09315 [Pseudoxanthomonas winnipegensis]
MKEDANDPADPTCHVCAMRLIASASAWRAPEGGGRTMAHVHPGGARICRLGVIPIVVPAKAGTQWLSRRTLKALYSRVRGNDGSFRNRRDPSVSRSTQIAHLKIIVIDMWRFFSRAR